MFLSFGLAFEVPIATVMLLWSGLVSIKTLTERAAYIFLGCFVVGMLLAPDVFSMTLLAVPMYLLYEGRPRDGADHVAREDTDRRKRSRNLSAAARRTRVESNAPT